MNKVALLVGASHYQTDLGLDDLDQGLTDFHAALQQTNPPFESFLLYNRPLLDLQEQVETLFRKRQPDDLVILVLTGYALEANGNLYFLQTDSHADGSGKVWINSTLSAAFLREVMDSSPARYQIVILDCIYRRHLRHTTNVEHPVSFQQLLGTLEPQDRLGAGSRRMGHDRIVLTAHTLTHHVPPAFQTPVLWGYLQYLTEGLRRGYADTNRNGVITIKELHSYAQRKLRLAAPSLEPAMMGTSAALDIPLTRFPTVRSAVQYAQLIERMQNQAEIDHENRRVLTGRVFLDDMQRIFELSSQQAEQIEFDILRPLWEFWQRLRIYSYHLSNLAAQTDALEGMEQATKTLKQALYLTERHTAVIDVAPFVEEQQQQRETYQENLARYEQAFLAALLRQYPISESDREGLHQLQAILGLRNDDVETAERNILSRIQQLAQGRASDDVPIDPIPAEGVPVESVQVPPSPASETVPPASTNLERMLEHLERTALQNEGTTQNVVIQMTPEIPVAPETTVIQPPPVVEPEPEPIPPIERSAPRHRPPDRPFVVDWLLPLLLIAGIAGTLAAVLLPNLQSLRLPQLPQGSSVAANQINNPNEAFRLGLQKTSTNEYTDAIAAYNRAIQLNPDFTEAYINRGYVHHQLGDLTNAIADYTRAIQLGANTAQEDIALSNRSHAYFDQGNFSQALADANTVIARNPTMPEALINRANAQVKLSPNPQTYTAAIADYSQAIKSAAGRGLPQEVTARAYTNRGNAYLFLNQVDRALADQNQAVQLAPNYADAHYNLGLVNAKKGDNTAAITNLTRAAELYGQQRNTAMQQRAEAEINKLRQGQTSTALPPS